MQGIKCLKGCGASIEDIQEYCRLCLLDESEENLRRIRKKKFYLRNGFHETGNYTIMLEDLRFEVICTDGELQREAFVDLIHIIHGHCAEFLDILL